MSIKPVRTRARHYPLTAYDFEWHPDTMEFQLAGVYDERGYKWFSTLKQFCAWAFTPGNSGRRFYAHFGGASDMVFLLKELIANRDYQIKGVFSGSSAILVTVKKGEHEWSFIDSFWLMRVSLAKIGTWLGMPKLKIDFRNVTDAEMLTYNERDCKILYDAIWNMQEAILERGGELGVTAASTAMKLFLRKYLKRPIKNSIHLDNITRPAYVASRVERYGEECERAHYFDINSSFPYSMTFPCPGNLTGTLPNRLPTGHTFTNGLWLADVTVRVPEQYVPPLPYRHPEDDRIFFPTGEWRTRLTSEDFKNGGFEILDVHSSWTFEDRDDLSAFAHDFYALRQTGGFEAEVYKIVLNSLYGKFAERDEKETLLVRPSMVDPERMRPIAPHVFLATEQVEVKHAHVPLSTFITARSRRLLREWIVKAKEGGRVYYVDTDSVICDAELPTSKGLGGLKNEYEIERGTFVASKVYALEKAGDEPLSERQVVKAKGFSSIVGEGGDRTPIDYKTFCELRAGREVKVQRMLRIRELLRKYGSDYPPQVVETLKKLSFTNRPKRARLPGGESRPWTVEELGHNGGYAPERALVADEGALELEDLADE